MKTTITCIALCVVLIAFQYGTSQEIGLTRPEPEPRPTASTFTGQAQPTLSSTRPTRLAAPVATPQTVGVAARGQSLGPAVRGQAAHGQAGGFTTAPAVVQGQSRLMYATPGEARFPLTVSASPRLASRESELAVAEAIQGLADAEGEDEREEAIDKIEQALGDQYDEYLSHDEERLEQMRERLDRLEEQFKKRQEAKERMVELKLEMIVSEADGIGWPDGRGGSGYFRRPMTFAVPPGLPAPAASPAPSQMQLPGAPAGFFDEADVPLPPRSPNQAPAVPEVEPASDLLDSEPERNLR